MKLLLTNFFVPFLSCTRIQFLVPFLVPLALRASTSYMRPHISGTERMGSLKQHNHGNLVVASLPVDFPFSAFLPKVSGGNVHWTEHESYLSYSLKSLNWCFLAWSRPSQATQYSSGNESPRDFQTREWGWLLLVLWQLPHALLQAIVWAFLARKYFAAGPSMYPCHMACISKSVPKDIISLSNYISNSTEAPWMWCAIVGANHSASLSHVLQGQVNKVVLDGTAFAA